MNREQLIELAKALSLKNTPLKQTLSAVQVAIAKGETNAACEQLNVALRVLGQL